MQPINDLSVKLNTYRIEINNAINRVIESGWLVLGPEVAEFERRFAEYHDLGYCVGVANGTDALELACKALEINAGDTVATVANAGAYTSTALLSIGAIPHFMEVDFSTQCVTLEAIQQAIDSGVNAIVITHLFGLAVPEIESIAELCEQHQVILIEDCAQAHGAAVNGKRVGSFGDAACFSFYPTKNLGALGDGGAVVTDSLVVANELRKLRQYGWVGKYQINERGGRNSRLDELQAAILSEFLDFLNDWNQQRRNIASRYSNEIMHQQVRKPYCSKDASDQRYVAHLYVLQVDNRDGLREHLNKLEIMSDIHYPIPDYRQKILVGKFSELSLHNTELLAEKMLTLPCYPGMTAAQIDNVINAVNSWSICK